MNYPYYFQQSRPTYLEGNNNYPVIKGRPVASIDEAKVSMIDFDGSIFYFPDTAHSRIYTKQINMDGTSTLKIYELVAEPTPPPQPTYVSKEEFDKTIKELADKIGTTNPVPQSQPEQPVTNFKF